MAGYASMAHCRRTYCVLIGVGRRLWVVWGFPKAPVKILQQGQCRLTDRLPAVLMLHRMLLLLLLFVAAATVVLVVVIVVVSMRTTGQMNNL